MRRFRAWFGKILLALLAFAHTAAAETPAKGPGDDAHHAADETVDIEAVLEESVIATPTRSSGAASSAPAVTSTLSAEDLQRYGIRSLAEALNFLALGMGTQIDASLARTFTPQIGARGVLLSNNNQVLILLNGHAVNDEAQSVASWLEVGGLPIELVDHIEVMLGPGSVLYGGNAMVGVINIVTKRAGQYPGVRAISELSVVPRTDPTSTRAGFVTRDALGGGEDFHLFGMPGDATVQLQFTRKVRPTYTYGSSERLRYDEMSMDAPSGTARLVLGKFDATVHADGSQTESTPRGLEPIRTDGLQGPAGEGRRDQRLNVDVQYRNQVTTSLAFLARALGDASRNDINTVTYDGLYACSQRRFDGCVTSTTLVTSRVGLELQATYDWNTDGSTSTMVGAVGLIRRLDAATNATDLYGQNAVNELDIYRVERAAAAYLQQTFRLGRRLSFNLGARFDYESRFGRKLSPRAAVVYSPWDDGNIKAIYSEAFRGPDIFESYFHTPFTLIQAGPLQPETVRSVELFLDQRFGTHRLFYGVFRTWWSDLVATTEFRDNPDVSQAERVVIQAAKQRGELNALVPSALRYANVETLDNYGANGGFEGSLALTKLKYGMNFVLAQAMSSGRPIDGAPRLVGNARIAYDFGRNLPTLGVSFSVSGRRFGSYGGPFPTETHVRPTMSGEFPGLRGLSYRLSFDYAFNKKSTALTPKPPDVYNYGLFPSERYMLMLGLQYKLMP